MTASDARSLGPTLIVITDLGTVAPGANLGDTRGIADAIQRLVERAERVLSSARPGSILVQLRDKELPARFRLALGWELRRSCERSGQLLAVNDRLDLAVLLSAEGVHLGEDAVSATDARRLLPGCWVSHACHDPAAVAEREGDAVLLSPIAAARKGRPALGIEALTSARARLDAASVILGTRRKRLYALGGIDARNAAECLAAGADGVAVIGSALDGRDPAPLLDALGIVVGR